MAITIFQHQMDAIQKLKNGSILVGGVGTGKSRTSLGYFYKLFGGGFSPCTGLVSGKLEIIGYEACGRMREVVPDLVIITTAKKRDTKEWEMELALYGMSSDPDINSYRNRIFVDSWNNIGRYQKMVGAFFIFDEQRVGGSGKWAKTFINITRRNRWILLSATPGDTWSDYGAVFVANNFYKHFTDFRRQHVVYNQYVKYPKIDHYVQTDILERHRKDILVYMPFKRHTLAHNEIVKVEFDETLYNKVLKEKWNIFKNEPCQDIASLCSVLRRVVNGDGSRVFALEPIFNKHHKLIIFYNYDYELEALRLFASMNDITCAEWNGKKHEQIPRTDEWVYLVQYSAGAEGWNCIETDCIVFYSQTYSYKAQQQAAGRIDRMNTPFTDLYYYHLISSSKMDIAISRCLRGKKDFNEKVFCEKGGIIFDGR